MPYRPGRGDHWIKSKCLERQEFIILGYIPSTAASRSVGSLALGYHDNQKLVYAGRVGTGWSQEQARALRDELETISAIKPSFAKPLPAGTEKGVRWVGWCLIIGILDQHSQFATDALQAHRHRQSQEIIGCIRRRLKLHLQIKRPGEQLGQAASRERDVDAIGSDFHPAKQGPERRFDFVWCGASEFFRDLTATFDQVAPPCPAGQFRCEAC